MLKRFILALCLFAALTLPCFSGEALRILFLTDLHVTPGNAWEKGLQKIIAEINSEKDSYDFAVVNGDLTNSGSDAELYNVKKCLDQLQLKTYVIPGNHESTWSESACQTLFKIWGNDRYEFRYKGKDGSDYYFIAFSTGPYIKMSDGFVKAEDLRWLEQKLKENASDPKTQVVVFAHYPLNNGLGNWMDVTNILKKYNVLATFCGHGHALRKFNIDGIPGLMGRPLFFKTDEAPGYNVIEIKDGKIAFVPRVLGEPEGKPFAEIAVGHPETFLEGLQSDSSSIQFDNRTYAGKSESESFADEASLFGGLAVSGNTVFFGNSLGVIKARRMDGSTTPKVLWQKKYDYSVYSTPVVFNNLLIFGSPDNTVTALDTNTGETVWTVPTHSPITNDGTLLDGFFYTGLGRDEFCKLDAATGKKIWSYRGVDGRFQAAPAISGDTVVFGAWNETLYALNNSTGEELWKWNGGTRGVLYSPGNVIPVISDSQVVLVAPDRRMTALDRNTGKEIWRTNVNTVRESMGTSKDGSVAYAKTMAGHVIAVSARSPKYQLLWDCDTGVKYDHVACPLLVHEGVIYYGSPDGTIVLIDAKNGKKLMSEKVGISAVNRFTADDSGRVWYTLVEGKFGCIRYEKQKATLMPTIERFINRVENSTNGIL